MATLKDVKLKIRAVKKTRQITKAMNMVATSRLRGAQRAMEAFRPYAEKFSEVLGSLAEKAGGESNPLLTPKDEVKRVHIVLCTSDRGLCGGFNLSLAAQAMGIMARKTTEFSVTAFGKRGRDWCRNKNLSIADEHVGVVGSKIPSGLVSTAAKKLVDGFLSGAYDEVHVVYSQFASRTRQIAVVQQLLPIPPILPEGGRTEKPKSYQAEHICEPSAETLLGELLPKNVFIQLYRALLETTTGEHAARMLAMDNATKACNDMIESLSLAYNKARQTTITLDLMDIVAGAEALRG